MTNKLKLSILIAFISASQICFSQTWVDSLDNYAREKYLPAKKYHWLWTHAALLSTFIKQYEWSNAKQKQVYFEYIKKAMDKNLAVANGRTPNDVASGLGLAFLYRITKDEKYKSKAEQVYADYLKIRRTDEGAVSHLMLFTELWDDTVFMIGQFLLNMYQATGDEQYLTEFVKQFRLHRKKLRDAETGLWYHGWDSDNKIHCTFCSQMHWADKESRRSKEIWGRGNGWIVVTLSDVLEILPKESKYRNEFEGYLKEMIIHLPKFQDTVTGHWFQLPVRNTDKDNWIESSSTAMFAYGINTAIRMDLVNDEAYKNSVSKAYYGLRKHSLISVNEKYLTTKNVCVGTCIGDKKYYFKRGSQNGKPYGLGMAIQFGLRYELDNGLRINEFR
jgi:unsaturated rhamnogalacturonyl hydrolase